MIRLLTLATALVVPALLHAQDAPAADPAAGAPKRVIIKTIKHMPDGKVIESTIDNPEMVADISCKDRPNIKVIHSEHTTPATQQADGKVVMHRTNKVMICAKGEKGNVDEALQKARTAIESDATIGADAKKAALEAIDKEIAAQPSAK